MSSVSQNSSTTVERARADLMAELENPTEWVTDEFGLSTKDAAKLVNALVVAVKSKTRAEIAADFEQFGKRQDSLSWGEAHLIASEGLCVCRGGDKPCDAEDIRTIVEGGTR